MKKIAIVLAMLILVGALCLSLVPTMATEAAGPEPTFSGNEWATEPNSYGIGSLNPRAHYYPFDTEAKAIANYTMFPESSNYYMTLKGTWKFNFAANPGVRPWPNDTDVTFEQNAFDASGWDDITVPGNWQALWNPDGTFKYERVIYTNITYPWRGYGNSTTQPSGTNNGNMPTVFNGVGTYRRTFTVPQEWISAGRAVTLNFDGVDSCYIWINGRRLGYTEDCFTHHEFDLTPYVLPGENANVVAVQVIRWAQGSLFEDQDFIRTSGIFRDVYLTARQMVNCFDFEYKTVPVVAGEYDGNWKLDINALLRDFGATPTADREIVPVTLKLLDDTGATIWGSSSSGSSFFFDTITTNVTENSPDFDFTNEGGNFAGVGNNFGKGVRETSISAKRIAFSTTITAPKLWSAEHPNLYKLVVKVGDEYTCVRIGFRQVEYSQGANARMTINGKPIMFHGANIHETNPDTGRTMTLDLIEKDLQIMKKININAVRMSHYPHDTRYYDLCDEYGLYVTDEANMECHGVTGLTNQAVYGPMCRDRQLNMLERDKNYPSIVVWSTGNECGSGAVNRNYNNDTLKSRDRSRPVHSQFDNTGADLYSAMYTVASSWSSTSNTQTKPTYLCEFIHAMGNSNGDLDAYIDVFELRAKSVGAFVWDWVDQSIWTPVPGNPSEKYLAYGSKWGDDPNDDNFCANGVLLADRKDTPESDNMRRLYQWLKVSLVDNSTYEVMNKYLFTNANEYVMDWDLTEDGKVIQSGSGITLDVDPAPTIISDGNRVTKKQFPTPFTVPANLKPGAEYFFNVRFRLRTDSNWGQLAGYAVSQNQMAITFPDAPSIPTAEITKGKLTAATSADYFTVTGPDFALSFDRAGGVINSFQYKGRDLLVSGPEPNFFRAPNDNEKGASAYVNGLVGWEYIGSNRTRGTATMEVLDNLVVIKAPASNATKLANFVTTYTIYPDGEVKVNEKYTFGNNSNDAARRVHEIGSMMVLPPDYENITWFGRGPGETYCDRKFSEDVNVWDSTVTDNFINYIQTQETGNKIDIRWYALTDDDGFGMLIKGGNFVNNAYPSGNPANGLLEVNALHYSPSELATRIPYYPNTSPTAGNASMSPWQLVGDNGNTFLRVNMASTGIGGDNSWGALPLTKYIIVAQNKTFEYNYSMIPLEDFDADEIMALSKTGRNYYNNLQDLIAEYDAEGLEGLTGPAKEVTPDDGEAVALKAYNDLMDAKYMDENPLTVNAGETVSVPITLKNAENIGGGRGKVVFDSELLELVSISGKTGMLLLSTNEQFVFVAPNALEGDAVIGYVVFKAKEDILDDVSTIVSFETLLLYNTGIGDETPVSVGGAFYPKKVNIIGVPPIYGDVNLDGVVDLADAILLMQYVSGNTQLGSRQLKAADVNRDGAINVADVIIVMQMCL